MNSAESSGLGHGTVGSPQEDMEETVYPEKVKENESSNKETQSPSYAPSEKHQKGHNWGSENPITSSDEGQELLDTAYSEGKQKYNITADGKIVKFQPDGTPENGYHSYEVFSPPDIPPSVLRKMRDDGKITNSEYKQYLKGKKKK